MNTLPRYAIRTIVVLFSCLAVGCATSSGTGSGAGKLAEKRPNTANLPPVATGRVSLEQPEDSLLNTVRRIGEQHSGGIVAMHGLGFENVPELKWKNRPFDDAMRELAEKLGASLFSDAGYAFFYPKGYELLNTWNSVSLLPPELAQKPVGVALGHGTKLSSAVAFLGHVSGITVIVDNAVADARTGEMWLPPLPFGTVLDAVLKGARVPPDAVSLEMGDNLVLVKSRTNHSAPKLLGEPSPALAERATVYLPAPPSGDKFDFVFGATSLAQVRPSLERQLGVPLNFSEKFGELPVEQCAFVNQTRESIIRNLIAQWPAPGIGYRWDGTGLVLEQYSGK